jgi:type 1 fimbriae regulatory protein FimB
MEASKEPSRTRSTARRKAAAAVRTRNVERVRRPEQRTIYFLTQDELRRLFKVIKSKRDKAIFLVAYRHGLRASEIGLLQRADVDAKQGRISIHRLKGSISAVYPIQPDVLKTIRSYLRTRTDESPYLFLSNRNVPISRDMLHHLMQTYGAVAGLPREKRKFHCLKHSIATHLLDAGADLAFVKDWLGHANIQNTTTA